MSKSRICRFKLNPGMPSAICRSQYRIMKFLFIHPDFEGVHLRMAKVARGGLRWSDRREDFRTEILGLMKAQQVKNAVIVPQGAKGGFVVKMVPSDDSFETKLSNGIRCYQNFIRGLLDISDNLVAGKITHPRNTVRYDDDDHYLVVAADKGTATFSDIANDIAAEYNFWLGDAFASGGKTGYDHKKMGITARGAWESVRQHGREMNINPDKDDFTVVGVGDMSGDVFGNGMLLSKHIRLVAGFNHLHIFIDPNPDAKVSFRERKRLFNLPRSTWQDYNPELISAGGGVFLRSRKFIKVSPEMKQRFDLESDYIVPSELLRAILAAEVDLLWNGGIGTYVKAENESHLAVGDPANDAIRVNGAELRCKMVGEGGNLGLTQLGRAEYALNGGQVYTDFIDNSAGVDCSDQEVNIKILLNAIVSSGEMTLKARDKLLSDMTADVATLVLKDNKAQTKLLSRASYQASENSELYIRYIRALEKKGELDRKQEFIPNSKEFKRRQDNGKGLTAPELSVLLAYSKNLLEQIILTTDITEEPALTPLLAESFPAVLAKNYREQMENHPLRREIIATVLSNNIVNEMGMIYVNQLRDETGARIEDIIKAYIIVCDIFETSTWRSHITLLDPRHDVAFDTTIENHFTLLINRVLRRATRWFLHNRRFNLNIAENIATFSGEISKLRKILPQSLQGLSKEKYERQLTELQSFGIADTVIDNMASSMVLFSALDIIEGAQTGGYPLREFASAYFFLGDVLEIDWLREEINAAKFNNFWEALARGSYRDDIDFLQRQITLSVLNLSTKGEKLEQRIEHWIHDHQRWVERWQSTIARLKTARIGYTKIYIAVRDLAALAEIEEL